MNHSIVLLMFMMGLFSQTQVRIIGALGISEFPIYLLAPFLFISHWGLFKSDKCMTFMYCLVLSLLGCIISCWMNEISFYNFMRGFATPYGWWASFVVFYIILRRNPMSFGAYLLGVCFSMVLCTFVFQNNYEMVESESRGGGSEAVMSGAIYWISRIGGFVNWPISAHYLSMPVVYSVLAPFSFGIFALLTTASGRSSALIAMAASTLIFFGRKNQSSMRAIRKHIFTAIGVSILFVYAFKGGYAYSASKGYLGEDAQAKYEAQTRGGKGLLSLLKAGRGGTFLGIYYVLHKPIWGWGPWAYDYDQLYVDYFVKYGSPDEYEHIIQNTVVSSGRRRIVLVGAHSAVLQFWLAYGILGLPVWIYFIYLIYDYFRQRIGDVPEFFGYFAMSLLPSLWAMGFSPFADRLGWGLIVAMLLLNRTMCREREFGIGMWKRVKL